MSETGSEFKDYEPILLTKVATRHTCARGKVGVTVDGEHIPAVDDPDDGRIVRAYQRGEAWWVDFQRPERGPAGLFTVTYWHAPITTGPGPQYIDLDVMEGLSLATYEVRR